jgi:hypothetical protein
MSHWYRSWYLASSAALLGVAMLWAGVSKYAVAAPDDPPKKVEPKKDPAKKEDPKKERPDAPPGFPDIEELIKQLPEGIDPEQMKQMRQQMRKMMEEMRKRFPDGLPGGANGFGGLGGLPGMAGPARKRENARLGAFVEKPTATLAEQLDLPKGQGMVVEEVMADSAAAKAGIKNHDILLELNGKSVPADARDFAKLLDDIKPNKKIEAVVLRKGKRETIKELSLPEAKEERPDLPGFDDIRVHPFLEGGLPGRGPGGLPGFQGMPGDKGVMTTIFRAEDRFTTRHQEGTLVITVTGTVADGKAKVSDIRVQDGRESNKYQSVDKVPERYRDKVKNLVEMSGKGAVKIEFKDSKEKE